MARARNGSITAEVVWAFLGTALLWSIPALFLLPVYLVVIAISVAASEGALLELALKARGGIRSALGLLLVVAAIVLLVLLVRYATEADDWVEGGFMVLITAGSGAYLVHRELHRLAREGGRRVSPTAP